MTALLTAALLATAVIWIVHGFRARAARRLQHAMDSYAEREIARRLLQRRSDS